MALRTLVLALCAACASAFTAGVASAAGAARANVKMADYGKNFAPAKYAPSGPLGGYKKPGTTGGFLGDKSKSKQIDLYEKGGDYLFFQGPAPKTAVQEDLPSFFDVESAIENLEFQGPLQILVTLTGLASFGALGFLLVTA